MLKVLHCIHSLEGGGAERQLTLLANMSCEYGMHAAIFCINDKRSVALNGGMKIYRSKKSNKFNFSIFRSLHSAISDFHPQVIHVWLPAAVTIPAMLVSAWWRIPCVFSFRNKMRFHRLLSYSEFIVATVFCSKVASNNPVNQSSTLFRWLYKQKSGETIFNAVEVGDSVQRPCRERDRFRFLFVGRLTIQKNILFLLEALHGLIDKPNWHLDVFGVGNLELRVRRAIERLTLGQHVTLRGYSDNIQKEMCNSDLLLFPSLYEGMPNVLLEALAIGLPVVAADIASSREIIKDADCVYWFDCNSKEQLIDRVKQFLCDPSSCNTKIENGKRLAKKFNKEMMAAHYSNMYRALI
ncbi:MAG: glycosyltransferase [Nitrospirales bacterium]|nr:glycosyltransferase [Nitrospirales bacterium]